MELLPVPLGCQNSLLSHCVDLFPVVSEGPSLSLICENDVIVTFITISIKEEASGAID